MSWYQSTIANIAQIDAAEHYRMITIRDCVRHQAGTLAIGDIIFASYLIRGKADGDADVRILQSSPAIRATPEAVHQNSSL